MLVLGRNAEQTICVDVNGELIEFQIVAIVGERVKVGITAAKQHDVWRKEKGRNGGEPREQ